MNALVEVLRTIPVQRLGSVLHLGAGSFALDDYARIDAQKLLLLAGDPEVAAELQGRGSSPERAEVLPAVVAPAAGPLTWHRYNLRMLDGPLPPAQWSAQFPRLRLQGSATVEAIALQPLIEERFAAVRPGGGARVLAIDLPGQEDALVAAVRPELLRRFDWIVLRCGSGADGPATARLAGLGFETVGYSVDTSPVWPVQLLRFDRRVHAELELRKRLAESERRAHALELQLRSAQAAESAAAAARDEAQARIRTLQEARPPGSEAALAALRKQLTEAQGALARSKAELVERDGRQRQIDAEVLKAQAQLELIKDVLLRERHD